MIDFSIASKETSMPTEDDDFARARTLTGGFVDGGGGGGVRP